MLHVGVSLYMCVCTYTMYMHISVTLCVLEFLLCMLEFLYVCVHIQYICMHSGISVYV